MTRPTLPRVLVVSQAFDISGRGVGVIFDLDPAPFLPPVVYVVEIETPAGELFEAEASSEYARKVPPGEVQALVISGRLAFEIPQGTQVTVLRSLGQIDS